MAQQLVDFSDIQDAIIEELGLQSSDTNSLNKIKRLINMCYINDVIPFKRWKWLEGHSKVVHKAAYKAGTCSVTPDSTIVTLSAAPAASQGSFANYLFSVDGFDEIYQVSSHTSQSVTVTLSSTFQGTLNSTASYKIWRDVANLPTDCRETVSVWHNRYTSMMTGVGWQEMRDITIEASKAEGFPTHYTTIDFFDPSSGDAEFETDRYRQLRIYPSINTQNVTLNIDYVKEISALNSDTDEPIMPIEDRIVLVYGTLAKAWASLLRNPEEAARNDGLYQHKLSQMAGRIEDSFDIPTIAPSSRYLARIRRSRIGRGAHMEPWGAGSGNGNITYLKDVTIEGATITANVTVNSGITIDGRDISVDGATLDSLAADLTNIDTANRVVITNGSAVLDESVITSTELTYLDDVSVLTSATLTDNSSGTVVSWAFSSFDIIHIDYSILRSASNIEAGLIKLVTDGTSASIAQGAVTSLGTLGVTLSTTISGSNLLLNYTTTSTGTDATFKYKAHKWKA